MSTKRIDRERKIGKMYKGYKLRSRRIKPEPTFQFNYPKTIVISITTHGNILINEDGLYETFKVRSGLTFYKINAVAPGICNILWDEQNEDNTEILERALHKVKTQYRDEQNNAQPQQISMYDFSNDVRNVLFGYQTFFQKPLKNDMEESKSSGEDIKQHQDYLHHFNKGFSLCDFTGAVVVNKGYSRTNIEGIGLHNDWQMNVINMAGKPDLLKNINLEKGIGIHHRGTTETSLKEILSHLYKHGVKRILMVDFSCSNFTDENFNEILTDRGAREIRANILDREASHCSPPTIKAPSKL